MSNEILPPYGLPAGEWSTDDDVLDAFVTRRSPCHSRRLHIEDDVLLVDILEIFALRLSGDALLVRRDLTEDAMGYRPLLGSVLRTTGRTCLDDDTLLGLPVALQLVGLRLSDWDLWGIDIDDAFATLRTVAAGEAPPTGPLA